MQRRRHVRRGAALPTLFFKRSFLFYFTNMSSVYNSGLARHLETGRIQHCGRREMQRRRHVRRFLFYFTNMSSVYNSGYLHVLILFSLSILFASSSTDLHDNAPGDYRFIDGGEVCVFFCGRSVEEKYR